MDSCVLYAYSILAHKICNNVATYQCLCYYIVDLDLGLPMIFLDCTTDYTAQTRSINVTWLLNSMIPKSFRDDDDHDRVQTCNTSLACRNGHKDLVCIYSAMHMHISSHCETE